MYIYSLISSRCTCNTESTVYRLSHCIALLLVPKLEPHIEMSSLHQGISQFGACWTIRNTHLQKNPVFSKTKQKSFKSFKRLTKKASWIVPAVATTALQQRSPRPWEAFYQRGSSTTYYKKKLSHFSVHLVSAWGANLKNK